MVWTECDEELGGPAGGDGEQLGEGLLGDVRDPRGHRPVDRRDQREASAGLHGRTHLRLHHRQAVPQLQVRHNICVRESCKYLGGFPSGLETDIGTKAQAGHPLSP